MSTELVSIQPQATFETITPEIAQQWLELSNPYNRKLREKTWNRYSSDMKEGHFILNPADAICFDVNGRLLNGQHRLKACVEAAAPFRALVVRNCDPDSFIAMDSGAGRTAADDLHQMGHEDPVQRAAVARLLALDGKKALGGSAKVTRSEIKEMACRYGIEIRTSIEFVRKLDLPLEISEARAAFCHLRFARQDMGLTQKFFQSLSDGTGLETGNPILLLTKALCSYKKRNHRLTERDVLGLLFKAWVMFRDGKKGAQLVVRKSEDWANIDQKVVPLQEQGAA